MKIVKTPFRTEIEIPMEEVAQFYKMFPVKTQLELYTGVVQFVKDLLLAIKHPWK